MREIDKLDVYFSLEVSMLRSLNPKEKYKRMSIFVVVIEWTLSLRNIYLSDFVQIHTKSVFLLL